MSKFNSMPDATATPTNSIDASWVRLLTICSHSRLGSRSFSQRRPPPLQAPRLLQVHQPRGKAEEHHDRGQQERNAVDQAPDLGRLVGHMVRVGKSGRHDQPQHQRQEENAEMHGWMVAGQVKIDHHQHPGRQQQPVAIAGKRRPRCARPPHGRGTPYGLPSPPPEVPASRRGGFRCETTTARVPAPRPRHRTPGNRRFARGQA